VDPLKAKETPVILIILANEYFNDMNLALSEVHSRGALTIAITDCKQKLLLEDKVDLYIEVTNKYL
jgi:glucosamine 6-phosphate synthetase-like amidotransferase/phosphosugar isomerase protein